MNDKRLATGKRRALRNTRKGFVHKRRGRGENAAFRLEDGGVDKVPKSSQERQLREKKRRKAEAAID